MTEGLLVLVQLVMAAITTEPWSSVYSAPPKRKGTEAAWRSAATWKPLNPCCEHGWEEGGERKCVWGGEFARLSGTADISDPEGV